MARCEFCKTEDQSTGSCAYCGTVYCTASATFIYGSKEGEGKACELRISDKYLIIRSVSGGEMVGGAAAGAAFGLLGALAAAAVDSARTKSYAFYDWQEVEKIIYPYHAKGLKKDTAFKFVNRDGSDFILNFNMNGLFSKKAVKVILDALGKVGIPMENGGSTVYPVCCAKPFVDKETFGTRVCPSAATFVEMTEKQFIAAPISATPQQPIYQAPVQPAPQQPVYQAPVQPAPQQPVYQAPVQPAPQQPIYQAPVQPAPQQPVYQESVQPAPQQPIYQAPQRVFCSACGAQNPGDAKFCSKCGKRISIPRG